VAGLAVLIAYKFFRGKKEREVERYDWLAQRSAPPFCPVLIE